MVATKQFGASPGVLVRAAPAETLLGHPPGTAALDATSTDLPRPGRRDAKRVWRDELAAAWGGAAPLTGAVFADVALRVSGSLLAAVEVVLDALEPVLGRDPRGRDWQEFFPNDHRIEWLRIRRASDGPLLRLCLGPLGEPAP